MIGISQLTIDSSAATACAPGLAKPAKLYAQEYISKPIISLNQSILLVTDMSELRTVAEQKEMQNTQRNENARPAPLRNCFLSALTLTRESLNSSPGKIHSLPKIHREDELQHKHLKTTQSY